jgi:hypothetical protein
MMYPTTVQKLNALYFILLSYKIDKKVDHSTINSAHLSIIY